MTEDEIYTIESQQQAEIKIKGSRFIGIAQPVTSEMEAKNFIAQLSRQYFDSSHNCYAYLIGWNRSQITRFSDAGEPSGTAGQPILKILLGKNLTDVIVVVVRYFGGTKLGTGGLARAYSDCAKQVINRCTIIKKYLSTTVKLEFDYNLTGAVMRVIEAFEAKILFVTYGQKTELSVSLRNSLLKSFEQKLTAATAGKISQSFDKPLAQT